MHPFTEGLGDFHAEFQRTPIKINAHFLWDVFVDWKWLIIYNEK